MCNGVYVHVWGAGKDRSLICCSCSLLVTQELYDMTTQEMSPGNLIKLQKYVKRYIINLSKKLRKKYFTLIKLI